jgi:hypothetical protein
MEAMAKETTFMKITRTLYLAAPITRTDGSPMRVHAAPITSELFDAHQFALMDTWAYFAADVRGRMPMASKRAHKVLLSMAKQLGRSDEIERGLLPEIRRLANVALFKAGKWEEVGYQELVDAGSLDADEVNEIEGYLVFFTLAWHLAPVPASNRNSAVSGLMQIADAQTSSLAFTEYLNSLRTSTADANSGASPAAAS